MRFTSRFIRGGRHVEMAVAATIRGAVAIVIVKPRSNCGSQQIAGYHQYR
jgi:hypothetical protein